MKRFRNSAVLATLTALVILVAGAVTLHSQSAQDLYQKALSQEKVQGNLEEAIALYQKVIAGAGSNRTLAAQAQYHIGLCYEKLGATDAEKAFRKVIDQYPEQKESVSAANERLALLAKGQMATRGGGMVLQQVPVPEGNPSPDGRFFAYVITHDKRFETGVKWSYDDIKLYDVTTGTERLITDLRSYESSGIFNHAWSPSGERIAFLLQQGSGASTRSRLCLVDRDGSDFRIINENQARYIHIAGWLPDESAMVVTIQIEDNSTIMGEISLKSQQFRQIKNLGKILPEPSLSPDGRFLAYEVRDPENQKPDIRVISRDGTMDGYIVQHPANDSIPRWTADSRNLLFRSDRSGEYAIWAQEVSNGKPEGNPTLILDRRVFPMGITKSGSFYFYELERRSDVYLAQVDLATGKTLKQPESIDSSFAGNKLGAVWSHDGNYLGYFVTPPGNSPKFSLRLRSLATGKEREYLIGIIPQLELYHSERWSPSGDAILIPARQPTGDGKLQGGIFRIDVQTGHSELLSGLYGTAFSANGEFAIFTRYSGGPGVENQQVSLFRRDLNSGEEKLLIAGRIGQRFGNICLSPDSKWIGYRLIDFKEPESARGFSVIPAGGGSARHLVPTSEEGAMIGPFFWWGPGESILFGKNIYNDKRERLKIELWYMPAFDSKQARKLDLEMPDVSMLTFHPDGKTIAFSSQTFESNVWVMENYLPAKK